MPQPGIEIESESKAATRQPKLKGARKALNAKQVLRMLEGVFGEDVHAKRVFSLAQATLGVIHGATLGVLPVAVREFGSGPLVRCPPLVDASWRGAHGIGRRGVWTRWTRAG